MFFGKSRWILSFGILLMLIMFINYYIPNKHFKLRKIIPGSLFSSIVWVISSFVFSYLVSNVFKFSLVYGSLNSIIIILIWLYISSFILILGIEINAMFIRKD
ncbi:MAG: YhjD/YihY/BrkB family envelope integrity protein [Fusobacteriota bacterium]